MFAIDIDGTLAFPDKALARFHNQDLQLGIPEHKLERIASYQAFIHLPETQQFLEHQTFPGPVLEHSRKRAQRTPDYLASQDVRYGAVHALHRLAKLDRITYYTGRDACAEEATSAWLSKHQFPHMPVVYCRSALQTLVTLYEREQGSSELIMVITDRWLQLLEAYHGLAQGRCKELLRQWPEVAQFVKERVILVGFGASQADVNFTPTLPVKALPSWEKIDTFTALFEAILR